MTDTFARDHLPAPEAWPDLLLLDGPARVNAALELLDHEGTAIAGGWSYAELRQRAEAVASRARDRARHARAAALAQHARGDRRVARDPAGGRDRGGDDAAAARAARSRRSWRRRSVTHALVTRELCRRGRCARRLHPRGPAGARVVRGRRHRGRRRRDHRLHLRHDRDAEGLRALPPRPAGRVRHVRARRSSTRSPDDVFSGTPPLAFTFGLGGLVLFPLRFGASTAPVAKPGPEAMLDAIRERRITTLFTAPTAYRAMLVGRRRRTRCTRASPPASRCPPASRTPGTRRPASGSSTASARPRCCTSSSARRPPRRGPARAGARCPATRRGSSTRTCRRCRRARSASSRCAGRRAAATSTTRARPPTCATAGTSPATRSRWTPTATSGSRPAPTT